MASAPPHPQQTRRRVVPPEYMDRLVMNYLVVEGHKEAAEALAEEAGVARESGEGHRNH